MEFLNFVLAQESPKRLPFPFSFDDLPPNIVCGDFFTCLSLISYNILRVIVALSFFLSVIFIAWAGILYITQPEKTKEIHQKIKWAVIGLMVSFSSLVFVNILYQAVRTQNVFLFPFFAFAQIQEPKPPSAINCGGVSLQSVLSGTQTKSDVWKICLLYYLNKFITFLYKLALILGVIFLSWAGVLYITQPEKSETIHQRLIWGTVGIIVSILSFTIVKVIENFFIKP